MAAPWESFARRSNCVANNKKILTQRTRRFSQRNAETNGFAAFAKTLASSASNPTRRIWFRLRRAVSSRRCAFALIHLSFSSSSNVLTLTNKIVAGKGSRYLKIWPKWRRSSAALSSQVGTRCRASSDKSKFPFSTRYQSRWELISLNNQAFANAHRRLAVGPDIPSAAAVSSMVMPTK